MEDSRARTLATLDAFLESQKQLLTRTQADLHKLAALRETALADPEDFIDDMEDILDDTAFQISEYILAEVPEDIDWDLFAALDPSVFNSLHLPGPPPLTDALKQVSPPSELQAFVRQAAKDILGDFRPYIPPDEDDLEEAANEQRLAELVNSGKPSNGSKPLPRRRVGSGLRLKHESDALAATWGVKEQGKAGQCKERSPNQPPESTPHVRLRSQRLRRPTTRPDEMYSTTSPTTLSPKPPDTHVKAQTPSPTQDQESLPPETPRKSTEKQDTPKSRKRGAPSETFNQPWTLDEQNHLERLLEEIPAGEKNRHARIF